MTAQDLELNCGVRTVLSRHWIDLTKTAFFARKGHVHMSGEVAVIGAPPGREGTADVLQSFEAELRRLREVKSVSFEFTNWVRDGAGVWICLEKLSSSRPTSGSTAGDAAEVLDLEAGRASE